MPLTDFDLDVRRAVYRHLLERGEAPDILAVAERLTADSAAVGEAFDRLAAQHVLVLRPGTREIWMAMPFSAVPTAFRVRTPHGFWWANCAWDALGIPALLAAPGTIETACADCGDPLEIRTTGEALEAGEGVVHFAVPAAHWWDDIGFT